MAHEYIDYVKMYTYRNINLVYFKYEDHLQCIVNNIYFCKEK